jgi:RNA polymerase sigma-70 factor (ECF subfamily)
MISRLQESDGDRRRAGLETLCRRYWKPVYWYLRFAWTKGNEDAKDLAQEFFSWLLEGDALKRFTPSLGRFRQYLKVVLRNFVRDHEVARSRLKRGGGVRILPLDGDEAAPDDLPEKPERSDPEEIFDHVWKSQIVREALERVAEKCRSQQRDDAFRVFQAYTSPSSGKRPTYAAVAGQMDLTVHQVQHYLTWVRREIRSEMLAELREMVSGGEELEEEWNALFGK